MNKYNFTACDLVKFEDFGDMMGLFRVARTLDDDTIVVMYTDADPNNGYRIGNKRRDGIVSTEGYDEIQMAAAFSPEGKMLQGYIHSHVALRNPGIKAFHNKYGDIRYGNI